MRHGSAATVFDAVNTIKLMISQRMMSAVTHRDSQKNNSVLLKATGAEAHPRDPEHHTNNTYNSNHASLQAPDKDNSQNYTSVS